MNSVSPVVEPLWRAILNYGCVFYFLSLPALAIYIGFSHIDFGPSGIPAFLREFHWAVSALVAAIAGLNSIDRRTEVKEIQAANGKSAQVDKAQRHS